MNDMYGEDTLSRVYVVQAGKLLNMECHRD
jgi:hypothetical protein